MIWNILETSSQRFCGNVAVWFDRKELKYNELFSAVREVVKQLKSFGVKKGDHVAILMDNSLEFIIAFFAVNISEAVILPIYPNIAPHKILELLTFYEVRFLVTLKKILTRFDFTEVLRCHSLFGLLSLEDDQLTCENEGKEIVHTCQNQPDVALILLSSGTTSIPKGIMLSNENIVSNVKGISEYLKLSETDRILLVKNITHASSITGEMLVSIFNGCTLYLTSKILTPSLISELISRNSITTFFAVPTILMALINDKHFDCRDFNSLRVINFYGAPLDHSNIKKIAEKFICPDFIYSYGLTEASPRVTYINRNELLERKNSSGKPISDVEVMILDEDEKIMEPYTVGEIAVKGPNVMNGYYKNEVLTKQVLKNGVLRTGDLGYLDNEGFLYVTGRKDNRVIIAGKNVYPEEIENVLYLAKGVKDVLVRGEKDDLYGQKIVAYIVGEAEPTLRVKNIFDHCKANLDDYKIPREIFLIKELHKTGSGKIIRNQVINFAE